MSNFNDEVCEYYYSSSVTENFGNENFGTENFGTEYFGTENFTNNNFNHEDFTNEYFKAAGGGGKGGGKGGSTGSSGKSGSVASSSGKSGVASTSGARYGIVTQPPPQVSPAKPVSLRLNSPRSNCINQCNNIRSYVQLPAQGGNGRFFDTNGCLSNCSAKPN